MSDSESSNFIGSSEDSSSDDSDKNRARRSRKKQKKKSKKKKDGKGKGILSHQTKKWDLYSKHGQCMAKAIVSGECDPHDFQSFIDNVDGPQDWVEKNYYTRNNLQRRHNEVGQKLNECCVHGDGFDGRETWLRLIGLEGRRGTGVPIPGFEQPDNTMPSGNNKKKSSAKKGSKKSRTAGGDDGTPVAASLPAPENAPAASDPDLVDLVEGLEEIDLGEGLPSDEIAPRLFVKIQDLVDPNIRTLNRKQACNALMVVLMLAPFMVWADVSISVIENGMYLLLEWYIRVEARDPENMFPKKIRKAYPGLVESMRKTFQRQRKRRVRCIKAPFQLETYLRRLDDADPKYLPMPPPQDAWNRWLSKPLTASSGDTIIQADMGVTAVFSVPDLTFDDVDRKGDNFKAYNMADDEDSENEGYRSDPSPRNRGRTGSNHRRTPRNGASSPSNSRRRRDEREHKKSGRPKVAGLKTPPPEDGTNWMRMDDMSVTYETPAPAPAPAPAPSVFTFGSPFGGKKEAPAKKAAPAAPATSFPWSSGFTFGTPQTAASEARKPPPKPKPSPKPSPPPPPPPPPPNAKPAPPARSVNTRKNKRRVDHPRNTFEPPNKISSFEEADDDEFNEVTPETVDEGTSYSGSTESSSGTDSDSDSDDDDQPSSSRGGGMVGI